MTKYELWHVKIGTKIKYVDTFGNEIIGTVIKREIDNECYGFIISKNYTKNLETGKKYLTVTVNFGKYNKYLDTLKPQYLLNHYNIIERSK